jgi:hypothetical protein
MPEALPSSPTPPVLLDPSAFRMPIGAHNSEKRKPGNVLKIAKPRNDDWVRIHPDVEFHWQHIWAREDHNKNVHILLPGLYDQLETQVQRVFAENDFYIAAVLNSDPIVWRVKHSDTEWFRTMQNAVEIGLSGWVQVQSNMDMNRYDVNPPFMDYEVPDWQEVTSGSTAQELFTRVFNGRVIHSINDEALDRIRGKK